MPKNGSQVDQKTSVYDDAVDDDKIDNLNKDKLHLSNGLGDNIINGNHKHNYIEQGGIVYQQDGQENHYSGANNNPQAQNEHFGGVNELDQNNVNNNINNNDDDNDNDDKNQNQGANNNNHAEISDDEGSHNDPNINDDNSNDNQKHNYDSARIGIMKPMLTNVKMIMTVIRMILIKVKKMLL